MKKSIYILLFLCAICFSFFGFGFSADQLRDEYYQKNAFRIIRNVNSLGQISISYIFPVNSDKLKSFGVSDKEVLTYQFYLTTYVNTLAQSARKNEVEGVEVSDCAYYSDVDGIGYSISFSSVEVQKNYFGISDDENTSVKPKAKGFFVKTLIYKTQFPVSSQKVAGDLKMVCVLATNSWADNSHISTDTKAKIFDELSRRKYIYDFATQEKSLKSKNCFEDDYFVHNFFVKTFDDLATDNTIEFYVSYPNKPIWYISALVVVILGMTVAFVVLKIKKNRKK